VKGSTRALETRAFGNGEPRGSRRIGSEKKKGRMSLDYESRSKKDTGHRGEWSTAAGTDTGS
jgi:hypothetical protein